MPMSVMCPHCLTVNTLPRDGAVYCTKCLHRADVPPAACDCPWCSPPGLPPIPPLNQAIELDPNELPPLPPIPPPEFTDAHDLWFDLGDDEEGKDGA